MFNKYFKFNRENFSNSTDFLALKGNLAINGNLNASNINLEQTSSINFGNHKLSINNDGQLTINDKKVSFMGVPGVTKMSGIINKKKTNIVKIPAPVKTIASVVKKPVVKIPAPVKTKATAPAPVKIKATAPALVGIKTSGDVYKTGIKLAPASVKTKEMINVKSFVKDIVQKDLMREPKTPKDINSKSIDYQIKHYTTRYVFINEMEVKYMIIRVIIANTINVVNEMVQQFVTKNKTTSVAENILKDVTLVASKGSNINNTIKSDAMLKMAAIINIVNNNEQKNKLANKVINAVQTRIKNDNILNNRSLRFELVYTKPKIIQDKIINNIKIINNNSNLDRIIYKLVGLEMDKHITTNKISNKFLLQRIKNNLISIFNSVNEKTCLSSTKARNMAQKLKMIGNNNVRVLRVVKEDAILKCIIQLLKNKDILRSPSKAMAPTPTPAPIPTTATTTAPTKTPTTESTSTPTVEKLLKDGIYSIHVANDNKLILSSPFVPNMDSQLKRETEGPVLWDVKQLSDGYYTITNNGTNYMLSAYGGAKQGNMVRTYYPKNPIPVNYKWKLNKHSDGTFNIVSVHNLKDNLQLSAWGGSMANNSIRLNSGNGNNSNAGNHKWKFVEKKIGKDCPCNPYSWCGNDKKCYESCYDTDQRKGSDVPRVNKYNCNYGNDTFKNSFLKDTNEQKRIRYLLGAPANTPFADQFGWCTTHKCHPSLGMSFEYEPSNKRINMFGTTNPSHVKVRTKNVFRYFGKGRVLKEIKKENFSNISSSIGMYSISGQYIKF